MYKKVLIILSALAGLTAIFILLIPQMLSYEKRIQANILVVEGWLPFNALHFALEEFKSGDYDQVLFTGSMLRAHTTLYINSFLVIYPQDRLTEDASLQEHFFEIQAKSSLGVKDSAHFVFWINDQAVADFYTVNASKTYSIKWEGVLEEIDSLMIQYTNDMYSRIGDRNLIINNLKLNGSTVITESTSRFVDRGSPFGRYRWNVKAESYADMAANYFLDRVGEKDKFKLISISNPHAGKRRTYGNALALRNWLENNKQQSVRVNIVSIDYHSRRTWLVYKRVLKDNAEVGILSVENVRKEATLSRKYHYIARESVAMIYYCVFILPWI